MLKKRIIIAYPAMMIGGSTTSLLSILNRLDYDQYDVDLLLSSHSGELLDQIPSQVKLLPPARKYTSRRQDYLHRLISPKYLWHWWKSRRIAKQTGHHIQGAQYREWKDIDFFCKIPGEYDVAIAFLEGDRCKFVARHIKARRKLAWIHVNYLDAHFNPEYDRDTMCCFDQIATVSESCKEAFCKAFPELTERTLVVENILASEYVRGRAGNIPALILDNQCINLVTVCRIDFSSKGLDRGVEAIARLRREGRGEKLRWYIVGDGGDMTKLRQMITDHHLEDVIVPCGGHPNPYPYLLGQTLFFFPSRWEGKPMAVTEAFMMGLPVLATEYTSAREQIRDGIDGKVIENSTEGIYGGLLYIIEHENAIQEWKENVLATDYSNDDEMKKVIGMIEEEPM